MLRKASHRLTSLGWVAPDLHPADTLRVSPCTPHLLFTHPQPGNPNHCSPVEPATMAFSFLLCLQEKYSKPGKRVRKMIERRGETQICNTPANSPCI